jgi:hypothetical protein
MLPTTLARWTHVAPGKVISGVHCRHRHQGLLKFLKTIDATVPTELDVHSICDNYATHNTDVIRLGSSD